MRALAARGMSFVAVAGENDKLNFQRYQKVIDRTFDEDVTGDDIYYVGDRAFYRCVDIGNVDLPNLIECGQYSFCRDYRSANTNLHLVNLPRCKVVGKGAFYLSARSTIPNVSDGQVFLPAVETIGENAFMYSGFVYYDIGENVKSIGVRAFCCPEANSNSIVRVIIRAKQPPTIGTYAFQYSNTKISAEFPNLTRAQVEAIANYPWNGKKFVASDDEWTVS